MTSRLRLRIAAALLAAVMTACPLAALAGEATVTALAATGEVELTGFTRAKAIVPLVAEASGKITTVLGDIGDPIGKNGVFAVVDPTFIELDLRENRVRQAQIDSRRAYDATEAARYRELVGKGSAAQSKLDELEQALDASRHELEALRVAEAVLQERLQRTRITAPAGWLVTERSVEPGQWVTQGQTVGQAGDYRTLLAPFSLTPAELAALRAAKDLRLTLPELGLAVPARIHRVNPGFDPQTRKIAVELALGDSLAERRGGLRTVLTLALPDPSGAVLVPAKAVTRRYEEHWVRLEGGDELKVVLLSRQEGPDGPLLRVASPLLHPGDRLLTGQEN